MKPTFIRDNEIHLRKAKLQSQLLAELCDMVDAARVGKVPANKVVDHWRALREIYDLAEFFAVFEKELKDMFQTAITPDCIEY